MRLALAALAFAFLPSQPDTLKLGVAKGAKLTTSNSVSIDADLKDASIKVGGRELPPEVVEKFEFSSSMHTETQFEDEYVSVDGARPTELVRSYRKATEHTKQHTFFPGAKPQDEDKTVESPLVDHAVAFTWDEKAEKYARDYKGDEGEKAWLEKLEARMDFAQILPSGKVEVGDTWKIDEKLFEEITSPGGSLSFPKKSKHDDDEMFKNARGSIEARYDGKREVQGRELSVIHLHTDLSVALDPDEGAEMPMKIELQLDLEGDYLWDSEHGHLASFDLEGPVRMDFSIAQEITVKDQKLEMEMKFELAGACKVSGKIE